MAVLGLRFCARAFSSCGKRGPLFIAVRGPLTVAASLVAEHRLQTRRLSSCGSWAQLLCSMWDLPRPGLEPVSPALAGRFSTTAPPGKPGKTIFYLINTLLAQVIFTCWVFPGIQVIVILNCLFLCLSQAKPQRTSSSELSECFSAVPHKSWEQAWRGSQKAWEHAAAASWIKQKWPWIKFTLDSSFGFVILGELLTFLHFFTHKTRGSIPTLQFFFF